MTVAGDGARPLGARSTSIAPWAVGRTDGVRPTAVGTLHRRCPAARDGVVPRRACRTFGTRSRPARLTRPGRCPTGALPGIHEETPMKAIWNGTVIAQSDDTVVVEGNHYFPADAVDQNLLRPSDTHTVCPWKGTASYWTPRGRRRHERRRRVVLPASPRMPRRRSATGSPSGRASPSSRDGCRRARRPGAAGRSDRQQGEEQREDQRHPEHHVEHVERHPEQVGHLPAVVGVGPLRRHPAAGAPQPLPHEQDGVHADRDPPGVDHGGPGLSPGRWTRAGR